MMLGHFSYVLNKQHQGRVCNVLSEGHLLVKFWGREANSRNESGWWVEAISVFAPCDDPPALSFVCFRIA